MDGVCDCPENSIIAVAHQINHNIHELEYMKDDYLIGLADGCDISVHQFCSQLRSMSITIEDRVGNYTVRARLSPTEVEKVEMMEPVESVERDRTDVRALQ